MYAGVVVALSWNHAKRVRTRSDLKIINPYILCVSSHSFESRTAAHTHIHTFNRANGTNEQTNVKNGSNEKDKCIF